MKAYEWIETTDGRRLYVKKDVFVPNNFGEAPMVIFDSMDEEYHHGVCRPISSRKEWQLADKESNSATVSKQEWAAKRERIPKLQRAQQRELEKDRRNASVKALKAMRENPAEYEGRLQARAQEQEQSAKKNGLAPLIEDNIK